MDKYKAVMKTMKHMEYLGCAIERYEQEHKRMDGGRRCTFKALETLLLMTGSVTPDQIPEYPYLDPEHLMAFNRHTEEASALHRNGGE